MERDKAIDRAAKLQAQMQSELSLGNEAAALAFAAAMQRLVLEHELNDAELDAHRQAGTAPPEEPIIERSVNLSALGIEQKHARNANLECLAGLVGRAHLCRILVRPRSNCLWFVGTAAHCEVAEYMLTILWRALNTLARKGKREARKTLKCGDLTPFERVSGVDPFKGYTVAFKQGFLFRLSSRYDEEKKTIIREEDDRVARADGQPDASQMVASVALVRLDKALQRTQAYIDSRCSGRLARGIPGRSSSNRQGYNDGCAAAGHINLRANSVKGRAERSLLEA